SAKMRAAVPSSVLARRMLSPLIPNVPHLASCIARPRSHTGGSSVGAVPGKSPQRLVNTGLLQTFEEARDANGKAGQKINLHFLISAKKTALAGRLKNADDLAVREGDQDDPGPFLQE